jgi:lysozyme
MDDIDYQRLLDQLIRVEGLTLHPSRDGEGNLVIGVGRNLDRVGVTRGEAVMLLESDVRRATRGLQDNLPSFRTLDVVRQRVLIHMAVSIGVLGVLALNQFRAAVESAAWDRAADEMLVSYWSKRASHRAALLAEMMRTGRDDALNGLQPEEREDGWSVQR